MTTSTRYVGTCAVCARRIKIQKNVLVHHGYKRPGDGQIQGDCFAVGMTPHEVSSTTAEAYREATKADLAGLEATKAFLEQATELWYTYTYTVYQGHSRETKIGRELVKVGEQVRSTADRQHMIPSFDDHRKNKIRETEGAMGRARGEIDRMTKLIDTWTEQPLTTVEEEIQRETAEKKAQRAAVKAERDARKAAQSARKAEREARLQAKLEAAKTRAQAILDSVNPSDVRCVREAYLQVLGIKLPSGMQFGSEFVENYLDRTELLRSAGLVREHNGRLMTSPVEVRVLMVKG